MVFYCKRRYEEDTRRNFEKGLTIGTFLGSAIGGLLGVLGGILMAPDSGANTRRKVQDTAKEIKESLEKDLLDMKMKFNQELLQSVRLFKKEIENAKDFSKEDAIEGEENNEIDGGSFQE